MKTRIIKACALVSLAVCSMTASAQTKLLFNIFLPHNYLVWPVFENWKQQVEQVTDGRVTITFPAKSVAPPADQWNAVRSGLVDGAFIFNGFAPKSIRTLQQFAQLPFLDAPSNEAASVAYWRTYKKFFAAHEDTPAAQIIGCFLGGRNQLYSLTDQRIDSVDVLRHQKMWSLPGTTAAILKNLDVSFTSGPAVRMQELASRHVVDGVIGISPYAVVQFQTAPYIDSATRFSGGIDAASFTVFVGNQKWTQISEADREAIMGVSGETLARAIGRANDAGHEQSVTVMKKHGATFVEASPEFRNALEKAGEPITKAWIHEAEKLGVNGQAALDYYQTQVQAINGH